MPLCNGCRKLPADTTWWERTRFKMMQHLFAEDMASLIQEKYTQGFADGRKTGYMACLNQEKSKEEAYQELVREGADTWIKKFEGTTSYEITNK